MNFIDEIQHLSESGSIRAIHDIIWEKFGEYLFGSNIESKGELSNFQIAFLQLLNERWQQVIQPLVEREVRQEFDSWYEDEGSYQRILLQSIDIKNIENGTWQILFEDDKMDLIVHLYMKEWGFDYTARTG